MIKNLRKKETLAIIYMTLLAGLALVWGFSIIPFPGRENGIINDHKRVIDLANIQNSIDSYYTTNNHLPQTLSTLGNSSDYGTPLETTDPQTNQEYGYIITSPNTYNLCATFSTSSSQDDPNAYDDSSGDYASYSDQFKHPSGYYCFSEYDSNNSDNDTISPSPIPSYTCIGDGCQPTSQTPANATNSANQDVTPTPYYLPGASRAL